MDDGQCMSGAGNIGLSGAKPYFKSGSQLNLSCIKVLVAHSEGLTCRVEASFFSQVAVQNDNQTLRCLLKMECNCPGMGQRLPGRIGLEGVL